MGPRNLARVASGLPRTAAPSRRTAPSPACPRPSALALAPISQVDFQGDGSGAALTVGSVSTGADPSVPATSTPVVCPTTLVINGAVTFQ